MHPAIPIGVVNLQNVLGLILLLISVILPGVKHAETSQAQPMEVEAEVLEAVQPQIEKEKTFGYADFNLLYAARGGNNKIRLVYSTADARLDSNMTKYLTGFTVTRNFGQWLYVGSRTVSYLTEKDFANMKSWADGIGKRETDFPDGKS